MAILGLDAKIVIKRGDTASEVPTVAQSDDHTDGTWSDTDVYSGELYCNESDKKLFIRLGQTIHEIPFSSPTSYATKQSYKTVAEMLLSYPANQNNEIPLPSGIVHEIDSVNFDMGVYKITGTNLTIVGFSQNVNLLKSTIDSINLITCTGNLFIKNLQITVSGNSAKAIQMTGSGIEAVDLDTVSFIDCTEIGVLNNIRQLFWTVGYSAGTSKGFTLEGGFSGGATIFNTRCINLDYVLKAGQGFLLGSDGSIRSNANIDVLQNFNFCEFDYSNFTSDESYQLQNCKVSGGGKIAKDFTSGDAIKANESRKSLFRNNVGTGSKNTNIGLSWNLTTEATTPLTQNTKTKVLGITTEKRSVHYDQPVSNRVQWKSEAVKDQLIKAYVILDGVAGVQLKVSISRYQGTGQFIEDVQSYIVEVFNFTGGSDYAFVQFEEDITPNEDDYFELHVENLSNNSDVTMKIGSWLRTAKY